MNFTKQNTVIDSLLPSIETYQNAYIKSSSVYFQGLKTNSTIPTADVMSDDLNLKPTGKLTSWADTGLVKQDLPFTMEINEYVSPKGKGYEVLFYTSDGKINYVRSIGFGDEAVSRTVDWGELQLPKPI